MRTLFGVRSILRYSLHVQFAVFQFVSSRFTRQNALWMSFTDMSFQFIILQTAHDVSGIYNLRWLLRIGKRLILC